MLGCAEVFVANVRVSIAAAAGVQVRCFRVQTEPFDPIATLLPDIEVGRENTGMRRIRQPLRRVRPEQFEHVVTQDSSYPDKILNYKGLARDT